MFSYIFPPSLPCQGQCLRTTVFVDWYRSTHFRKIIKVCFLVLCWQSEAVCVWERRDGSVFVCVNVLTTTKISSEALLDVILLTSFTSSQQNPCIGISPVSTHILHYFISKTISIRNSLSGLPYHWCNGLLVDLHLSWLNTFHKYLLFLLLCFKGSSPSMYCFFLSSYLKYSQLSNL